MKFPPDSYPISVFGASAWSYLALCEALIAKRRILGRHAAGQLFTSPAWDMLIDLYVAKSRHMSISISSLAYSAEIPLSTGARLVQKLEKQLLFERNSESKDRRLSLIEISHKGENLIQSVFDAMWSALSEYEAEQQMRSARWRAALGEHTAPAIFRRPRS